MAGEVLPSSTWALEETSRRKVATAPAAAVAVVSNVPLSGNDLSLIVPRRFWSLHFSSHRRGGGGLFAQLSRHLQGEDCTQMERLCGSDALIKFQATSVTQASSGREEIKSSTAGSADEVEAKSTGISGWKVCS